jgi:hypothetical protein
MMIVLQALLQTKTENTLKIALKLDWQSYEVYVDLRRCP